MAPVIASYSVSVLTRQWLNEETYELTCTRPPEFHFQAGQYVSLMHQGEEREYTILSPPDAETLRFVIKQVNGGIMSGALANLTLGTTVEMSRARGYLTFRSTDRQVYFVATGAGIAPFVAMAAAGVKGFAMIHGAKTASGLFYRKELVAAARQYIPCLSGTGASEAVMLGGYHGHVTAYTRANLPSGLYDFYLCGSRAMIHDMTHLLDQYYPGTRIYSEAYS